MADTTVSTVRVGRPRRYKDNASRQKAYRERQAAWRVRHRPKVYHLHNTVEWETPPWLFEKLNAEFGLTLDVCAQPGNAKCPRYFTPAEDGLAQPWEGVCWMNPPYGRTVECWMRKAYESAQQGAT